MKYFFVHLLSSLGHCVVSTILFGIIYFLSRDGLAACLLPVGIYLGRETLDNARNYYETLKAGGVTGEQARAIAQGWRGWIPFWHWTLDGILDFVLPMVTVFGLWGLAKWLL